MSDALAAFHFLRPWWLLLLAPAIGLWWLQRRRGDTTQRWRRVIDPELLKHLIVVPAGGSVVNPINALLVAWIIGIVAVAGPTWQREPSPFAEAPPPAVIVLRVTKSMETPDLPPNRLERAQQKIADLLELREGAATGLIAYSGSAHLVLPPTADKEVVLTMAQALSPQVMPRDGDRLADAVGLAFQVLAGDQRGGSVLILADTVAPDQLTALRGMAKTASNPPVAILGTIPPAQLAQATPLNDAADALDAHLVSVTADRSDVAAIARRLAQADRFAEVAGEGERWREAGYWLTPLFGLLVLAGFRRGWVVPG